MVTYIFTFFKNVVVLILILFFPEKNCAQLILNKGLIHLNSGATMQVNGAIQSNGSASINNNGTITVAGDFINNTGGNVFGTSVGTVLMPSGSLQNISGNSITRFNNLTLLGGEKSLQINAEVGSPFGGVLSINNAVLNLNSKTLTILNPSSAAVTNTTGYILSETDAVAGYGTMVRNVQNASGAGVYTFPFGNATTPNLYVTFNFSSGISSAGQVSVSTYPTVTSNSPNNRPLPFGINSLVNFFGVENASNTIDRYWVTNVSGFPASPVSTMTLTYAETDWQSGTNTILESSMLPQLHNFINWSPILPGTINTTSNTMQVSSVSNYLGVWTLAGNNSPLPVELLSFTASPVDNREVLCRWTTATEVNNDYFTVQRSADGNIFENIGMVDGMGNTSTTTDYSFTDLQPFIGLSYYRLQQTDFDGGVHFSNVVPVWIQSSTPFMNVFPNPTSGEAFIWLGNLQSNTSPYLIHDVAGRLVDSGQFQSDLANRLDFSRFESGIYSLRVMNGSIPMHARVIVE